MKHLLVLAFAVLSLVACANEVVVESEPSGAAGQGGSGSGGSGSGSGSGGGVSSSGGTAATTGSNTTTIPIGNGCSMECTDKGESKCSCVRTCIGGSLGPEYRKVVCKPIPSGIIECVCTLDSGTFSGVCYEKKQKACDFDDGCCANYFSGK